MKYHFTAIVLLLMAVLLISCQSQASENVVDKNAQYPLNADYPVPQDQAYPAPEQPNQLTLYPDLKDGDQIDWVQLQGMLRNGEVAQILTGSAPNLTVVLKDSRTFTVLEPGEGTLTDTIKQCGDLCTTVEIK